MAISRASIKAIRDPQTQRVLGEVFNTIERLSTLVGKAISSEGVISSHLPGGVEVQGDLLVKGSLRLTDGITVPSSETGVVKIYVDSSDGDLKILFGDGFGATIQVDS